MSNVIVMQATFSGMALMMLEAYVSCHQFWRCVRVCDAVRQGCEREVTHSRGPRGTVKVRVRGEKGKPAWILGVKFVGHVHCVGIDELEAFFEELCAVMGQVADQFQLQCTALRAELCCPPLTPPCSTDDVIAYLHDKGLADSVFPAELVARACSMGRPPIGRKVDNPLR